MLKVLQETSREKKRIYLGNGRAGKTYRGRTSPHDTQAGKCGWMKDVRAPNITSHGRNEQKPVDCLHVARVDAGWMDGWTGGWMEQGCPIRGLRAMS